MKTFMTYGPANRLYEAAKIFARGLQPLKSKRHQGLLAALADCDGAISMRKAFAKQIAEARERTNDDLEIDDDPVLSPSDDGVWVSAWLWVPK